jgi:hypothetical protein
MRIFQKRIDMLSKDYESKLKRLTLGFWASKEELEQLAEEALLKAKRIQMLMELIFHEEPQAQAQAARVISRIADRQPSSLQAYKNLLIQDVTPIEHWIVRVSFCKVIPKLKLTAQEVNLVVKILLDYLNDESSVVKTCAMQALFELTLIDPELRDEIMPLLELLTHTGTPAMRARGRILHKKLHKTNNRGREHDRNS